MRTTALVCLAGPLGLAGCGGTSDPGSGRGVLLVAIDGLRADHVGALGAQRPTTPTLDALAARGVVFADAFSAAPLQRPAHVGLLTGTAPLLSRRFLPSSRGEERWRIAEEVPRLAVEFLSAGYRTAAFLDDPQLAGVLGIRGGFQRVLLPGDDADAGDAPSVRQGRRLLDWLRSMEAGTPWFAYLHVADLERSWSEPIQPWDTYFQRGHDERAREVPPVSSTDRGFFGIPHSRWRGASRYLGRYEASYDGHLRMLDEELGALLASLRRLDRDRGTTIAVVGTFGTQFGEAGLYLRAGAYSLADLHVPWILRPRADLREAPASVAGRRVEQVVSLLDVGPTLLEAEGIPLPPGLHGTSRLAWLQGGSQPVGTGAPVFASCGLIEGYAAIDERHVVEVLQPDAVQDETRRFSWMGEDPSDALPPRVRAYDREAEPYPPLVPTGAEDPWSGDPERAALGARAARWSQHVEAARRALQGGALRGEAVPPQALEELVRLGYLGRTP